MGIMDGGRKRELGIGIHSLVNGGFFTSSSTTTDPGAVVYTGRTSGKGEN